MTRFEDKLELELEAVVAENAAPAPKRRRFGWKPRIALVGAVAAAATAIAVSGVVQPASPAWAVEKTGDDTVRIKFIELRDPDGLEQALAKLGIRSEIAFVPYGRRCAHKPGQKFDPDGPVDIVPGESEHWDSIELRYRPQRPDQTVVLRLADHRSSSSALVSSLSFYNVIGPVSPCEMLGGTDETTEVEPK
ncbi:hypothetical protein [Tenggerimyces flavus]|uniref:Uncharacterized protein n=1 Tax=Tenggerimyces flavus TaxID=1708749 RepID=A0ABV7YDV8_9ACTN|nr:hypothetical protein [Tenggerimyces flavus]MBM7785952.1 hypothetical protein [Tenggerimyces flavus]